MRDWIQNRDTRGIDAREICSMLGNPVQYDTVQRMCRGLSRNVNLCVSCIVLYGLYILYGLYVPRTVRTWYPRCGWRSGERSNHRQCRAGAMAEMTEQEAERYLDNTKGQSSTTTVNIMHR